MTRQASTTSLTAVSYSFLNKTRKSAFQLIAELFVFSLADRVGNAVVGFYDPDGYFFNKEGKDEFGGYYDL